MGPDHQHHNNPTNHAASSYTHKRNTISFWKGKTTEPELRAALAAVDAEAWKAQRDAGAARIALDGTAYDQVLDTIDWLGVAPPRFSVRIWMDVWALDKANLLFHTPPASPHTISPPPLSLSHTNKAHVRAGALLCHGARRARRAGA